ncbi:amino acid permease, theoretically lysine-specific [Scleroderma citrinum]
MSHHNHLGFTTPPTSGDICHFRQCSGSTQVKVNDDNESNLPLVDSSFGGRSAGVLQSFAASPAHEMKRAMQGRHLMMLAIGGTIGTGIFLSAGSAVAVAGPGSALLSYLVVGLFVYTVVISLCQPCFRVSGAFSVFGSRFFWAPQVQPWQWALVIIVPIFALQLIHVRVYGESEYWFALIKVLMIVVFIFVGLIYDWGGIKAHPGAGFGNFARTFVYAFYSFGGVELVAIAAGESSEPYKTVPRAIKATFFRIVLFYILTILTIGLCINWKDPTLLTSANDSDVTASPITVVFQRAGFGTAVHVVNAVLLTAVLSATNSAFYGSSRMLVSLARTGQAPRFFGWVTRRGVPVPALLLSLAVACLTFLTTIWGEGVVFTWLLNLTGISALLVWGSIGVISFRFRAAYQAQGRSLDDLPYVQPLFPLLPIGVVVLALLMFIAEGYSAAREQPFNVKNVVATYIGVVLYVTLYGGYMIYERHSLGKKQHLIPLLEVDLDTDAVWKHGEGSQVRKEAESQKPQWRSWPAYITNYIY